MQDKPHVTLHTVTAPLVCVPKTENYATPQRSIFLLEVRNSLWSPRSYGCEILYPFFCPLPTHVTIMVKTAIFTSFCSWTFDSAFKKMATLDGDLNDSLTEMEPRTCSPETVASQSSKEDSKSLIERDGEIGFMKNNVFRPMTNFSVRYTGYVVDDDSRTGASGTTHWRATSRRRLRWEDLQNNWRLECGLGLRNFRLWSS